MSQIRGRVNPGGRRRSGFLARYKVGEVFTPRTRRLESPTLADKMVRRAVTRQQVEAVLLDNEIIEVYDHEDRVRCVFLRRVGGRPLHVVVADDDIMDATVVLSVYEPDRAHGWDPATGFRTRTESADE
jgi:hypothetical protein